MRPTFGVHFTLDSLLPALHSKFPRFSIQNSQDFQYQLVFFQKSQDNERLILRWVPMDRHHSPWLHRIQHPMTLILQRLMKVIILWQAKRQAERIRNRGDTLASELTSFNSSSSIILITFLQSNSDTRLRPIPLTPVLIPTFRPISNPEIQ